MLMSSPAKRMEPESVFSVQVGIVKAQSVLRCVDEVILRIEYHETLSRGCSMLSAVSTSTYPAPGMFSMTLDLPHGTRHVQAGG
jgi:hypothetical protein